MKECFGPFNLAEAINGMGLFPTRYPFQRCWLWDPKALLASRATGALSSFCGQLSAPTLPGGKLFGNWLCVKLESQVSSFSNN